MSILPVFTNGATTVGFSSKNFIQIQSYGLANASIGCRFEDQLYGHWPEPALFYTSSLNEENEFVYAAIVIN